MNFVVFFFNFFSYFTLSFSSLSLSFVSGLTPTAKAPRRGGRRPSCSLAPPNTGVRGRKRKGVKKNVKILKTTLAHLDSLPLSRFSFSSPISRLSPFLSSFSVPAHQLELVVLERADGVRVNSGQEPPPLRGVLEQGRAALALLPVEGDVAAE